MMNKKEIVDKHSPIIKLIEPRAPLSIGNGDFGMSVDFTGLQSFPDAYVAPLSTQSNWGGWHAAGGDHLYTLEDLKMQPIRVLNILFFQKVKTWPIIG